MFKDIVKQAAYTGVLLFAAFAIAMLAAIYLGIVE